MNELMSEGGVRHIMQDPRFSEDHRIEVLVEQIERYTDYRQWMIRELGVRVYEREKAKQKSAPAGEPYRRCECPACQSDRASWQSQPRPLTDGVSMGPI